MHFLTQVKCGGDFMAYLCSIISKRGQAKALDYIDLRGIYRDDSI